jgi:hypothetical protein
VTKVADTKKYCDLKCSRPQTYAITVATTNGAEAKMQIKIDNCQDLYGWFAVAVVAPTADAAVIDRDWTSENLTIRLWIQAGQYASGSGLRASTPTNVQINQYSSIIATTRNFTLPSTGDATVTKIFQRMGLSPRLQTNLRDQYDVFFHCDPAVPPLFDFNFGFFTFSCQRTANDRHGYHFHETENGTPPLR